MSWLRAIPFLFTLLAFVLQPMIGRAPGWVDDVMRHSTRHPQGGWVPGQKPLRIPVSP